MRFPQGKAELWEFGQIKAFAGLIGGLGFLALLILTGSDTCLDAGGQVVRMFYCQMKGGTVIPFPKLLYPNVLLTIVILPVTTAGIFGWALWKRRLRSGGA